MIVLINYYWNGWLLIIIDKRWSLDMTIGNYIYIFFMYIQYLYNDTWFKTKIPQTPFRLVIQKEWHCTGTSPPPIWRPTSQANPWSSKKNEKKALHSPPKWGQNEAKQEQIIYSNLDNSTSTDWKRVTDTAGAMQGRRKPKSFILFSSVSLILPISSISLNIFDISWYLPVKTSSFGCRWNRTDRSNNSGQSQVTTGRR